ncbi:MAG: hypothetical protein MZU97_14390 [Bacillus subtilis]|nr:hypothetical protein [Bacillus subtilis]
MAFAWIYRNAANILYPGDQYGYYFDEPSDLETISVLQILASTTIEIEFRFVAMPQIDSLTVSTFTANHEWIETATVVLTILGPWSVEADASAAYAVVEEALADGGSKGRSIRTAKRRRRIRSSCSNPMVYRSPRMHHRLGRVTCATRCVALFV